MEFSMKKGYIIFFAIVAVILGIAIGIILNNNNSYDLQKVEEVKLANKVTQNTENLNTIMTSTAEVITSPNCKLVFNTYYKQCEHTISETKKISSKSVNKTKEQLQEIYRDWEIKEFSEKEVVLYSEEPGNCREHFVIRDENGYIAIYNINEKGEEILEEQTDIITNYLPEIDKENLKKGIKIIGRNNLNLRIEDYE